MKNALHVTGTDLAQWADTKDSQVVFPLLVRRLIYATASGLTSVQLRTGEGTAFPGWDAIVNASGQTVHVPRGPSYWEMGVTDDAKKKADDDYDKRAKDPLGAIPANSTYVFVTPRRWGKKGDWQSARGNEGVWANVWALDGDDLDAWLELAPAVQAWFSRHLGRHPTGVIDLEGYLESWSGVTQSPISPSLILAGRAEIIKKILDWIAGPPAVLALRGETIEEVIAIVAAVSQDTSNPVAHRLAARTVVVETDQAWRDLVAGGNSPALVSKLGPCADTATSAVRAGHHVLVPLDRSAPRVGGAVNVPALDRTAAVAALVSMGFEQRQTDRLVTDVRGSLTILRRQLATNPALLVPAWTASVHAEVLASVLLLGAWDESVDGDRALLARITGRTYDDLERALVQAERLADAPLRRDGSVWRWTCREDAWTYLADRLTAGQVRTCSEAIAEVLATPSPRFDLAAGDRFAAAIHGKAAAHSDWVREGLAVSLALISTRADALSESVQDRTAGLVDAVVRLIFVEPHDWRCWASLRELLSVLAEASPEAFMDALEVALSGQDTDWRSLFEEGVGLGSPSHTGVLWALEMLAWNPCYLSRVALLLARLEQVDPGGKWANRPHVSFAQILSGWLPQTSASLDSRMKAVDVVIRREPKVAWRLLMSLLPETGGGFATYHQLPRWRAWAVSWRPEVTNRALAQHVEAVTKRMIALAGDDAGRWLEIVKTLDSLPGPQCEEALVALESRVSAAWPVAGRIELWREIREVLHRHRSFPDAEWALGGSVIARLDALYAASVPASVVDRYAWLFTGGPNLPVPPTPTDHEAEARMVDTARREALRTVYASDQLDGLVALARAAEQPVRVGELASEEIRAPDAEDALLDRCLCDSDVSVQCLAQGFIAARYVSGDASLVPTLQRLRTERCWSDVVQARAAMALRFAGSTWDIVGTWGEDVERAYWQGINAMGRELVPQDIERALRRLLEHDRPEVVLALGGMLAASKDLPASMDHDVLLRALEAYPAVRRQLATEARHDPVRAYHLQAVFKRLEDATSIDEVRLARLELVYLTALERGEVPRILHRALASEPGFFVEILKTAYRAEGEAAPTRPDVVQQALALQCYRLLESWKGLPGRAQDGSVDEGVLRAWVHDVRRESEAAKRGRVGDQRVGAVLARSPDGVDNCWPHEAVREVLETVGTPDITQGFVLAVRNARGVFAKGAAEGGTQERLLASKYRSYAIMLADNSPKTASILRTIADSYERQAANEDVDGRLNR